MEPACNTHLSTHKIRETKLYICSRCESQSTAV
jgi:hypothetical protein